MLTFRKQVYLLAIVLVLILYAPLISFSAPNPDSTSMIILVDRSGSMRGTGGDPKGLSRAAVEFLLDQLELASEENRCALVLFNSKVTVIPKTGLSSDFEKLRSTLGVLSEIGGNTDLEEALNEGLQLLSKCTGKKQMVLISDGKPEPDFTSIRAAERFPELFEQWRKTTSKASKRAILEKLSEISTHRIKTLLSDVLRENGIELYPVALSGIQAGGEELLKEMAIKVTRDIGAFKKADATDLIKTLDTIVPKPIGLMNILRSSLKNAGQSRWYVDFDLSNYLKKVRILILYNQDPKNTKWELTGLSGIVTRNNPDSTRYSVARDTNGEGNVIYERIFLDNPPSGHYKLSFNSSGFIPPLQVIIEGRTDLRLAVTASPLPAEVGIPVTFYCRIEGTTSISLASADGELLDDGGRYVKRELAFLRGKQNVLESTWLPPSSGKYRLRLKAYLDKEKNRYLTGEYYLPVKAKEAVKLDVVIPVRR